MPISSASGRALCFSGGSGRGTAQEGRGKEGQAVALLVATGAVGVDADQFGLRPCHVV